MRLPRIFAVAGILLVAFFATPGFAASQATVAINDDQFSKAATLVGPTLSVNPFGGVFRMWRIRSWVDKKTLKPTHQLYVDISYSSDWRWYDIAADDHANDLIVTRISSNIDTCNGSGCDLSETVGIALDDDLLRARVSTGFAVKLSAKSGDALILTISADQIADQLRAIDAYQRGHGASDQIAALPPLVGMPPPPLGIGVLNYGSINRRLYFGLDRGLKITDVNDGSVAARAGLKKGDWLLDLNGTPLKSEADLNAVLGTIPTGASASATIKRDDATSSVVLQF